MQELLELDVSDSMKKSIEALSKAMDTMDIDNRSESEEKLKQIHRKVVDIEEYFYRPVDSRDVYERLMSVAQKLEDEEKAGHYRSKIKLFKANDLEFKGRVQDFYGNKASALEYYSKALEFVPDHELANPARDKVLKRLDKDRMELGKIEKKLQIQDEDPRLWFKYGVVLLSLGEVDKAIECFDKVITLDSADPDAFARRGTAMESLGDYSGAKKYFEKALELKPNSMIAKRGLNYAGYFLEH